MKKLVASILLALLGAPAGAQETADLILHNGKIFTADDLLSIQKAVVIRDRKIAAAGGEDLVQKYQAPRVIDLRGRLVTPGFNDAHIHIRGRPRRHVELGGSRSIQEIQDRVRAKVEELGAGEWITDYGWSEDELAEKRRPLRWDLNEAAPENPVLLPGGGTQLGCEPPGLEARRRHQ